MAALRALDVGWPGYGQPVPLMSQRDASEASPQIVERSDSPHELETTTNRNSELGLPFVVAPNSRALHPAITPYTREPVIRDPRSAPGHE